MDHTHDRAKKICSKALTQKNTPAPAVVPSQTTFIRALCANFTVLQPAKLHIREEALD